MEIPENIKLVFSSKSPVKIPTEQISSMLQHLYINQQLSQSKMGELLGVQSSTVQKWLIRCNIPIRDKYDAVSLSLSKSKTYNFSGNLNEKAYLIGIRCGDLYAQIHGRKIRISVATTHPAMLALFEELFNRYGKVKRYPKYDKNRKRYLTSIYCDLDRSFSFLFSKESNIPKWIMEVNSYFISFLSGYFDADGCISIDKNNNTQFIIKTCDKGILDDIHNKLRQMGFSLRLTLAKEADHKNYNHDYWYLGTGKKSYVSQLIKLLELRHAEKILKASLIDDEFSVSKVEALRSEIKNSVKESMSAAEFMYISCHTAHKSRAPRVCT